MKYILHNDPESPRLLSCGELIQEDDEHYFINAAEIISVSVGYWNITSKMKVVPKSESEVFDTAHECMKRWFEKNMIETKDP